MKRLVTKVMEISLFSSIGAMIFSLGCYSVVAIVLIGIIVWSIFLWIVNLETVDFIIRGATKFMYQFLVLMIIFSGVYMFGERSVYSTFYGLVSANTVMMIMNLRTYGISASISSVMAMLHGAVCSPVKFPVPSTVSV